MRRALFCLLNLKIAAVFHSFFWDLHALKIFQVATFAWSIFLADSPSLGNWVVVVMAVVVAALVEI